MSKATRPHNDVKADVQRVLNEHGGHVTTDVLYSKVDAPKWQILKCVGWLGHITVPGKMYEHSTVWDFRKAPADVVPPEDAWIKRMFEETASDHLPSGVLFSVAGNEGFSRAAVDRALVRLQCPSRRINGKWHRMAPGTVDKAPEPPTDAVALLKAALLENDQAAPVITESTELEVLRALHDNGGMLALDWEAGYSQAELRNIYAVLPELVDAGYVDQNAAEDIGHKADTLSTITTAGMTRLAKLSWAAGQVQQ